MRVAIFKLNHCGAVSLLPTVSLVAEKNVEFMDQAKEFCADTIPYDGMCDGMWLISTDTCEMAIVQNGHIVAHSRF